MFGDVRFVCMGGTPQVNLKKLDGKDSFKRTVHKFGLCAKVNQIFELCFDGLVGSSPHCPKKKANAPPFVTP